MKRTKLAPKLMLLTILMITIFTGFACTFAVAKDSKRSTRLGFYADEGLSHWVWIEVGDPWEEDGMLHQRYYKEASLEGTIEVIGDFLGKSLTNPEGSYDVLDLHVRIDLTTGKLISIGKVTMHIFIEDEENGPEGTFYGSVIAKRMAWDKPLEGKYVLQGTGDFEGMKLFGTVCPGDPMHPWENVLSGTILVPN